MYIIQNEIKLLTEAFFSSAFYEWSCSIVLLIIDEASCGLGFCTALISLVKSFESFHGEI